MATRLAFCAGIFLLTIFIFVMIIDLQNKQNQKESNDPRFEFVSKGIINKWEYKIYRDKITHYEYIIYNGRLDRLTPDLFQINGKLESE